MNITLKIVLILAISLVALNCKQLINKGSAEYLKSSLREKCTAGDTVCHSAVESKFDGCFEKFEKDWDAVVYGDPAKEDELTRAFMTKMSGCIVDEDGQPFFTVGPE